MGPGVTGTRKPSVVVLSKGGTGGKGLSCVLLHGGKIQTSISQSEQMAGFPEAKEGKL